MQASHSTQSANPRLQLPRAEIGDYLRKTEGIGRFLNRLDISIGDIDKHQLMMFIVAQNLETDIRRLKIPAGEKCTRAATKGLSTTRGEGSEEGNTSPKTQHVTSEASDIVEVARIQNLSDLPHVMPRAFALMDVEPDLFHYRAILGELPQIRWTHDGDGLARAENISSAPKVEEVSPRFEKNQLYIILDTSQSMWLGMESRAPEADRYLRGIIARGFAIEAIRQASDRDIPIHFRNFSDQLGELKGAVDHSEIKVLVRHVLDLPNNGSTDIQGILTKAAQDIANGYSPGATGVILITDGYSKLAENPLSGLELHSVVVGDPLNDYDDDNQPYIRSQLATLESWSKTYHQYRHSWATTLLVPSREDVESVAEIMNAVLEDRDGLGASLSVEQLANVMRNSEKLIGIFKKNEKSNLTLETAERLLKKLREFFKARKAAVDEQEETLKTSNLPNLEGLNNLERSSYTATAQQNQGEFESGGNLGAGNGDSSSTIRYLLSMLRRAYRWANSYFRTRRN